MRVLVPVDGSPGSERAVAHLISMLKTFAGADVRLLNVQPPLPPVFAVEELERLRDAEAAQATVRAKDLLTGAGIRHETEIEFGDTAQTILSYASAHGCDQIVMGAQGAGVTGGLPVGSVATRVVQLARVPVLLVK